MKYDSISDHNFSLCCGHCQVEELKVQLESCHKQLMDSNRHKLELEGQLKNALEHEQQIRAGYISPVGHIYVMVFIAYSGIA